MDRNPTTNDDGTCHQKGIHPKQKRNTDEHGGTTKDERGARDNTRAHQTKSQTGGLAPCRCGIRDCFDSPAGLTATTQRNGASRPVLPVCVTWFQARPWRNSDNVEAKKENSRDRNRTCTPVGNMILNHARLPIPPLGRRASDDK